MNNNDVLRSIRYILNVNEDKLIEIAKMGGVTVTKTDITAFLKREDEPEVILCPQNIMIAFLNGLIYCRRGKDENRPLPNNELPTNNVVLKKLRVAFTLKDEDIIDLLKKVNFTISKAELSAFFRKEDHPNYRECGDQFLRNFLKGLALRMK